MSSVPPPRKPGKAARRHVPPRKKPEPDYDVDEGEIIHPLARAHDWAIDFWARLIESAPDGRRRTLRRTGDRTWVTNCLHADHVDLTPSMTITEAEAEDGRLLFCCHSRGCDFFEICGNMRVDPATTFTHESTRRWSKKQGRKQVLGFTPSVAPPLSAAALSDAEHRDRFQAAMMECTHRMRSERDLERDNSGRRVHAYREWADRLPGISVDAFRAYWCGEDERGNLAIAHLDGDGQIVGVALRSPEGRRWCLTVEERDEKGDKIEFHSRCGIVTPGGEPPGKPKGVVLVCEGQTDAMAAWTAGYWAVSKGAATPSPQALEWLAAYLKKFTAEGKPRYGDTIRVVADRDENGTGLVGAKKTVAYLVKALGRAVECVYPPGGFKDLREYFISKSQPRTRKV
ncbi:MAG TPA: toprim domain-containing protein [Fimbriiglobus sp.]|jgi:hypothetical protein